ncbi:unnamed protein product [Peniophora sp. CBMAI 1063]|nr:unnamed protein product [Peniophora sp. CBMAI 1063]
MSSIGITHTHQMDGRKVVVANKWAFCYHGHEYCRTCVLDSRAFNDGTPDKVPDADYRKALSIAGSFSICMDKQRSGGNTIKFLASCKDHNTPNCPKCFNWEKLVKANAKKRDSGKVGDPDRLLHLLRVSGVEFPEFEKLITPALEKKLVLTLDYLQHFVLFTDMIPLAPADLPLWTGRDDVHEAVSGETDMMSMALEALLTKRPTDENTVIGQIHKMVFTIADRYTSGADTFILHDTDQQAAIGLRVLGVYNLKVAVPLVSVIFRDVNGPAVAVLRSLLQSNAKRKTVVDVECSLDHQLLIRRLLFRNSARLAPEYWPVQHRTDKDFTLSFLLPLSPLHSLQLGMIAHNAGCIVCGKLQTTRCSACLSERYCSPDCQKEHWKDHKAVCQSVRDGRWMTFHLCDTETWNGEEYYPQSIDMNTTLLNHKRRLDRVLRGEPPKNVHGDKVFLIHVDGGLNGSRVKVHDRTRSIQSSLLEQDDGANFRELLPRPTNDLYVVDSSRTYRWARRTGDWELSICLDRKPTENTMW